MPTEANADRKPSSFNMPVLKWERRKRSSTAYAPSIRSGCTMALWQAKNTGVLFGGVTDEDTNEETLESVFHNDLHACSFHGEDTSLTDGSVGTVTRSPEMAAGSPYPSNAPNKKAAPKKRRHKSLLQLPSFPRRYPRKGRQVLATKRTRTNMTLMRSDQSKSYDY